MIEQGAPLGRRRAVVQALLIACAVTWLLGLIPRWGQWYSVQPYYRAQVRALFEGRLALTHDVGGAGFDLAWVDGGVQQVWGLGVPLWLSIWETIGRAIHLTPFPDRVAMLFGMALMMYGLLRAWSGPGGDRTVASRGAFLFTALMPGVVTMLRGSIGVYEEAAAYAYGAAMLLLAGTIAMIRRPSTSRYVLLLAFAGATGLVRPTVWFYGAGTAVVASVLYVRHRGSLRRALGPVALAWGLFLAGGGALYLTNSLRFGDGAEFGHRLNLEVSLPGNLYATRFDYAFATAPAVTAAKDLIGGMFDHPELALHRDRYDKAIHAWQAEMPRWREYYFTTYTWAYVPFLFAGVACCGLTWWRLRRPRAPAGSDLDRDTRWLGAWALIGGGPLIAFYLHSPSLSSRYLLDLAPMIGVLLVTAWRHAAAVLARGRLAALGFAALVVWWAVSATGFRVRHSWLSPVGATAAVAATRQVTDPRLEPRLVPPGAYDLADPWLDLYLGGDRWKCPCLRDGAREAVCDHRGLPPGSDLALEHADRPRVIEHRIERAEPAACLAAEARSACSSDDPDLPPTDALADAPAMVETRLAPPALYGNGTDWDLTTGAVGVATYLFADDPAYVEVEVAPIDGRPAGPGFVPAVRAKVQLEELPLVFTASTARGVRLRFAAPRTPRYRHGLQVIFLGFGPPDRLDRPVSDYALLRVAWRDRREDEP